jgi:prephenate dehydratase
MANPKRIVFQGEPGANSHIACQELYPKAEAVPAPTFEDCFAMVEKGAADLAMIPIDNSLAGRVADIHHLLPDSGLHIVGEYFLPIRFQLMAPKGATLKSIRSVASHVHALGQCRKVVRKHGWKAIVAGDTAGAAREIAEAGDLSRAALAPRLAAEIYGLEILAEDVADGEENTTRFVILSQKDERAKRADGLVITTFVFRVRNVPAAL